MAIETTEGLKSNISLSEPLNTASVSQDIHKMDTPCPAIANNGIFKDGGLSEVYEETTTEATADRVFMASNGGKVLIKTLAGNVLTNITSVSPLGVSTNIGTGSNCFVSRIKCPDGYSDIATSSDETHLLGIRFSDSGIHLDEILISTMAVTNTQVLAGTATLTGGNGYSRAKINKANTLTYASVASTSGIVVMGTTLKIVINGVVGDTAYAYPAITSYFCGGTVLWLSDFASIVKSASPYNSATDVLTGVRQFGARTLLISSATTLTLGAVCYTTLGRNYQDAYVVTVSAVGVVATATSSGVFTPATLASNYPDGYPVITIYGGAGYYKNAAGTAWGYFRGPSAGVLTVSGLNSSPPIETISANTIPWGGVSNAYLKANIALGGIPFYSLDVSGAANIGTGVLLNDYAIGNDISSVSPSGSYSGFGTKYGGDFAKVPDIRGSTSLATYGMILFETSSSGWYVCAIGPLNTAVNPVSEIGNGILRINSSDPDNAIIDTNTSLPYTDVSGYLPYIVPGSAATVIAPFYSRCQAKYSVGIDVGSINLLSGGPSSGTPYQVVWNGSTDVFMNAMFPAYYTEIDSFGTYSFSPYVPVAIGDTFHDGVIDGLNITTIQQPNFVGCQLANVLEKKYQAAFIIKGEQFLYDGVYIYLVNMSNGQASTMSGVPSRLILAQGLTFLCNSPDTAFFLSPWDNSIWTFTGSRDINKSFPMNQKPAITSGVFCEAENTLLLNTATSVIYIRDGTHVTENLRPWGANVDTVYSTSLGIYHVYGNAYKRRTYKNTGGTLIPLVWQSGYMGLGNMAVMVVNRIKGRLYCPTSTSQVLTVKYNWITEDANGQDVATVNTTPCSTGHYFTFNYTPTNGHQRVLGFSIELSVVATTQRIIIMEDELQVYYTPQGEASINNQVIP